MNYPGQEKSEYPHFDQSMSDSKLLSRGKAKGRVTLEPGYLPHQPWQAQATDPKGVGEFNNEVCQWQEILYSRQLSRLNSPGLYKVRHIGGTLL